MADDLRELVRAERRRRGWSQRTASAAGGCANTTWSNWESGRDELGGAVQTAVSVAFDWPVDWPTKTPAIPATPQPPDDARHDEIVAALETLTVVAAYIVEVLSVLAASRQIELPDPPAEVSAVPVVRSGRRKGDRP